MAEALFSLRHVAKNMQKTAVASIKGSLGDAWESFTEQEQKDVALLLESIATARLLELAGSDVSEEVEILTASYLQWEAAGKIEAANAVRAVAKDMLEFAGVFGGSVLRAVVAGI